MKYEPYSTLVCWEQSFPAGSGRCQKPFAGTDPESFSKKAETKLMDERLIYEILSVVEEIPEGNVASYGQIARLIGRDRNARLVGKVLSMSQFYGDYPCHRVVNHAGRLAPHFPEQRERLKAEGVTFRGNGNVDMRKHQWQC